MALKEKEKEVVKKESKKEGKDFAKVSTDRKKAVDELVAKLRKDHGDGAVFHGDVPFKNVDVIPTGSLALDISLGVGGLPRGRIVEIYGPEASGKTTLTLEVIANAQKQGLVCGFLDVEHALDPVYAKAIGVNMDDLLLSQPDNAEQAMEIAKAMVESKAVDILVVDSIAALVPKSEIEGEFEKANVGLLARIMSKACRTLTGIISENNVLAIFINQYRMKIGVMYGDPRTTTGGEAMKYYASVRLAVRQGEKNKRGDEIIGGQMIVKVAKNKLATPFVECEIPVIFGEGFDKVGDLYVVAKRFGIIDARGAHHYFNGEKFASKGSEAIEVLKAQPELYTKIEAQVREEYKKRKAAGLGMDVASSTTSVDPEAAAD